MQERGSADTLYIRVAAGDYYLTEPVVIRNTTRPVVITGEGEERPRLMGGLPVTGWEPCGEGRYRAYIPQAARYGLQFEQFYVDGNGLCRPVPPMKDGAMSSLRGRLPSFPVSRWHLMRCSSSISILLTGRA